MDLFTEGQKLTLFFQKNSNMVELTCEIEKIYDDRLDLILPKYFMRYIEFLDVGARHTAKAFSKIGTIDFNTVIISSPFEDQFTIELDYNSLKLTYSEEFPSILASEIIELSYDDEVIKLKTFEISMQLVKFYSDKKFSINEIFDGKLILPKDYGIISFKARISEIDPIYSNEYTALFETMAEKDRQTLLYYMYVYNKDIN